MYVSVLFHFMYVQTIFISVNVVELQFLGKSCLSVGHVFSMLSVYL